VNEISPAVDETSVPGRIRATENEHPQTVRMIITFDRRNSL